MDQQILRHISSIGGTLNHAGVIFISAFVALICAPAIVLWGVSLGFRHDRSRAELTGTLALATGKLVQFPSRSRFLAYGRHPSKKDAA
jgi:hypothetical protein